MTHRPAPLLLSVLALGLGACDDVSQDAPRALSPITDRGEGGGTGASGGASGPSSGGTPSTPGGGVGTPGAAGGGGGTPGAAGGTGGVGGATTDECAVTTEGLDPSNFPECPTCVGQPAHCVPTDVVEQTAPGQAAQLAACDDASVCVPDVLIRTLGKYAPPTCTSIAGGAGRCLSVCIEAVADLENFLPQDACPDGEKCAPCTDPRTGQSTGACALACDDGPLEPAPVFDRCCEGDAGICVPPTLVDERQAAALGQLTCGEGTLCAPAELADATFTPKTCTSVGGAEGRCLSTCVALVGDQAELLPRDDCAEGELCAPCTDPRTGELTGACSVNGDAPTEEPVVFDSECCDGTGLCVPTEAVPAEFASLVPEDTCATSEGAGWVCAPKLKLEDLDNAFQQCTPLVLGLPPADPNEKGACVPQCIADAQIATNPLTALGLAQSDCPMGWVCAPCNNPLEPGNPPTGACE